MKIDLHVHTVYSGDSDLTIEDLFVQAAREHLAAVAVTDHDMLDGLEPARAEAGRTGICLVPGVEASCSFAGRMAHLLVYSDTIETGSFPAFLDGEVFHAKRAATLPMIEALAAQGLPVSAELYDHEVQVGGKGGSPLERLLERQGVISGATEYQKRIAPMVPPEAITNDWAPSLQRGIAAAHEADALAIFAHPHAGGVYGRLSEDELDEVCEIGLAGLEVDHPCHNAADRDQLRRMAESKGLLITGGSDCHGTRAHALGEESVEAPDRSLPSVVHLRDLL